MRGRRLGPPPVNVTPTPPPRSSFPLFPTRGGEERTGVPLPLQYRTSTGPHVDPTPRTATRRSSRLWGESDDVPFPGVGTDFERSRSDTSVFGGESSRDPHETRPHTSTLTPPLHPSIRLPTDPPFSPSVTQSFTSRPSHTGTRLSGTPVEWWVGFLQTSGNGSLRTPTTPETRILLFRPHLTFIILFP